MQVKPKYSWSLEFCLMVDPFPGPWDNLGMTDLVTQTRNRATIIWFNVPNPILLPLCNILGINSRQSHISTWYVWEKFANSCHVVSYHDRQNFDVAWNHPEAMLK
jgi:hypothetical protein